MQFLVTEMYKLAKCISPTIILEILRFRNNGRYNLKSQNTFEIPFRNSVYSDTESISYWGPKVWKLVPDSQKKHYFIDQFPRASKEMEPRKLPMEKIASVKPTFNFLVL